MCGLMDNFSRGVQAAVWAFPALVMSLIVFPYVVTGDQEFYRSFYEGVAELPFAQGFDFYKSSLGTSEPGYFLLAYLFSGLISKDLLFSILNFILFHQLFLWMLRNDVSRFLYPLCYLNFYILVLAFSAERLKLSLLLFLIGCCASSVWRVLFFIASIFSHVQVLILIVLTQIRKLYEVLSDLVLGRVGYGFLSLSILSLFMIIVLFLLKGHIVSKLHAYIGVWGGEEAMLKPLVFTVLSMLYAQNNRLEAFAASLPLVVCAYFVGGERIVIFSFFVFMFYALQFKRGLNWGVAITSLYFSYQGLFFVVNIFSHGDGFAGAY